MELKKKMINSLILLIITFLMLLVSLIAYFAYVSHAWFSSGGVNSVTGKKVTTKASFFELMNNESAADTHADDNDYDAVIAYFSDPNNGGYSTDGYTTPNTCNFFCKMKKEWPYSAEEKVTIEPGAFGYMTFDIVLTEDVDYTFNIALNLIGVKYTYPTVSLLDLNVPAEAAVNSLVKGHILLFENRTQIGETEHYYYSDRIETDFDYDTTEHAGDKTTVDGKIHYKVEIYWIWAISFSQMTLEPDDEKLHTSPMFEANSADRRDLLNYIADDLGDGDPANDNVHQFFYNISYTGVTFASNYQNEYYVLLNNGYNNGDQLIGDTIRYVAVDAIVKPVN